MDICHHVCTDMSYCPHCISLVKKKTKGTASHLQTSLYMLTGCSPTVSWGNPTAGWFSEPSACQSQAFLPLFSLSLEDQAQQVLGTPAPEPFVQASPQTCSQVAVSPPSTREVIWSNLGPCLGGKSRVNRRMGTCFFAIRYLSEE